MTSVGDHVSGRYNPGGHLSRLATHRYPTTSPDVPAKYIKMNKQNSFKRLHEELARPSHPLEIKFDC